jgi:hypothetical protein
MSIDIDNNNDEEEEEEEDISQGETKVESNID